MAVPAGWLFSLLLGLQTASAENLCERQMHRASTRYDIPIGILYAVGLTETGHKDSLQPYAMNIEGKAFFMPSAAAALAKFNEAHSRGAKLIDIGCMQINHYFHADKFPSVEAMLNPAANVDYAARFLKELRTREGDWTMAVARYHAGPNNDPAQKQYVCRVIENMVATGFGNWTPKARMFCDK
ncbi:transglycosylase SLT domain-containing protein [Phyllobacterium sp. 1468]|uniref:transglycosylase SLT domain-containing protein n=1 Tax=Phyllobacterium sp. 1468 TaxID=2817759 RepID=UPI001AE7D753|nr:transglycosylase SLT domain-containing protein [Phyllobacterium sp. 1468]